MNKFLSKLQYIFNPLKDSGILGMNRRLGGFILPRNARKNFPLVDDKSKTDILVSQSNLPMVKTFFSIETNGELKHFTSLILKYPSFVIKPARGSQGNGIMVVHSVRKEENSRLVFITSKGEKSLRDITYHISSILSGLYSLNGMKDKAIIQEKLDIHPLFKEIAPTGIPDIRVIIYKGYPVMAMVRLPTEASSGRANLHQGAVGCGIKISSGIINHAVHYNQIIEHHPDTNIALKNVQIPLWEEVLQLSSRCYDLTGLGYLGIDVVIDPIKGPLLLEMNARPGLSIQIANLAGLVPRLEKIDKEDSSANYRDKVTKSKLLFD